MLPRSIAVALLTLALLTAGLGGPAAGEPAPVIPETVTERLDGLPATAGDPNVSAAVATPIPFSMVGFEVPRDGELEFRTSADGKQWSEWTEAEGAGPDEGPDPKSAEARAANTQMTEPVWVGEATHIQARVDGEDLAKPEQLGVELIDSAGLGRSWGRRTLDRLRASWRGTPPPAHAIAGQPPIVTRKQWGADERLRKGSPSYAPGIVMGVVHHTAGSNRYSKAEAPAVIRGVYRYHTQSRGWSDVGYNFLIDRYGTIYEGRYGGIEKAVIGAHSGGFNTGTFGASLVGNFTSANPPAVMRAALEQLLAWKYDVHHVDVLGRNTYTSFGSTKYASGRKVTLDNLAGHRDVSSTACPARIYAQLPALRSTAAQLQGPVLLDPSVSPTTVQVVNGSSVSGAVTLSARLRPAGPWALEVRDPNGAVVHTAAGSGETATSQWIPTGAARGTYDWTFTSPDRRSAEGQVNLVAPEISVSAAPSVVRVDANGRLATPVRFSGKLYNGARWRLTVTDPGGSVVHTASGSGRKLSATWPGPARGGAGVYSWSLAADDVPPASGTVELFEDRVARIANVADAARAAVQISQQTFGGLAASRVVLTRADLPAFALPAGPLAGSSGPVLYTGSSAVPSDTLNEIRRVLLPGSTIYVMGNSKVIADAALTSLSPLYTVQRIGDASPVRTAAAAADVVLAESRTSSAYVVGKSSDGWRLGLAASAAGADQGIPVLLTGPRKPARATRAALARNGVTSVTVVGGTKAVGDGVRSQLNARRVGSNAAAGTARGVAKKLFGRRTGAANQQFVFVNAARSDGWVRALAAAPRSARADAPLLVTGKRKVAKATAAYLERLGYSRDRMGGGWVLGGARHATEPTRDALSRHLQ